MGQAVVEHLVGIRRLTRRLGEESPVEGGAEIPAPDSGISFRCGWMGEGSAVPPGESEALGDGVPPRGCGAGGGPVACESGFFLTPLLALSRI